MAVHRFVNDSEVDHRIEVGGGVTLLATRSGESKNPDDFMVEHTCGHWPDQQEPDGELVKVIAPALNPAHTVAWTEGRVTVRASIACPDCGLHGFITASRWEPC